MQSLLRKHLQTQNMNGCSHCLHIISSLWCRTLSLCTQGTFDANDEIKPSNQKHIPLQQLLPY
ncbi:hypothetical protein DPMN_159839 [Dreissena polymorpha]|uniref:Uncharacterized protein n=1 Tax=Dreissena polymorpha TaxID=45954 RepID=A0A9D4ELA2_DREPO|nr:hypothetical protein DPMN_159839 [Dreissena polymorpha]